VKVRLNGRSGQVGSVLAPALEAAGHELVELGDAEAMVDFTAPDAVEGNVRAALEAGVPVVVGTSGWNPEAFDEAAKERGLQLFYAPNFAIGAVLMMRFAAEASRHMARGEIVELHHDGKLDAPSGTALRTAGMMEGEVPIHSVRLPGLVAHQEVLLGGHGETLTIRHDSLSRDSFMPGVVMAVRAVPERPGLTLGLEPILFAA
jgi:4-hydroxy-tetrahydrodipicolinate reductase